LRRAFSAEGPRDVEERQPREEWLKRGLDDRETCHSLLIERAEKNAAECDDRLAELDMRVHAVRTRPSRIPRCNLGDRRWNPLQRTVNHTELSVDVLGSVDPRD
jgi:hypothetical protein